VDGIVFWTKNIGPFLRQLDEVRNRGFPFVIQHTINNYPRVLETSVVDAEKTVSHFVSVAEKFGPRSCVWRYDTILSTSLTPPAWHIETFGCLAEQLKGATDEVVISFAHIYAKTQHNLNRSATEHHFSWSDPSSEAKLRLVAELATIASENGIKLNLCSQPEYVGVACGEARCVDAERLASISGGDIKAKEKGNRPGCLCHQSKDIGEYDTCPHGCVYCYAVRNRDAALERFRHHDPNSEFLVPPPQDAVEADESNHQLTLFEDV